MQEYDFSRSGRRRFLKGMLATGAFSCMGGSPLLARALNPAVRYVAPQDHKFLDRSGMSYQKIFDFAYKLHTIPLLQRMAAEMGKERFIDMLKSLSADIGMVTETQEFWSGLLDSIFWTHVITREIIEESDTVLKYNVTECLWAKTFREAEAGDIGFALFCYPDFARARVAHRTLKRTKTLMQGDEHCDFFFEIDAQSS
jgi:hypothetical protein